MMQVAGADPPSYLDNTEGFPWYLSFPSFVLLGESQVALKTLRTTQTHHRGPRVPVAASHRPVSPDGSRNGGTTRRTVRSMQRCISEGRYLTLIFFFWLGDVNWRGCNWPARKVHPVFLRGDVQARPAVGKRISSQLLTESADSAGPDGLGISAAGTPAGRDLAVVIWGLHGVHLGSILSLGSSRLAWGGHTGVAKIEKWQTGKKGNR